MSEQHDGLPLPRYLDPSQHLEWESESFCPVEYIMQFFLEHDETHEKDALGG
jgi:hypothetical protein